jgi:hypothetical protein
MQFYKVCYTEIGHKGSRQRKTWSLYGQSLAGVQEGFSAPHIEDVHIIEWQAWQEPQKAYRKSA